jgi:hypothetical protein
MKVKAWNLLGLLFILIFAASSANLASAFEVTQNLTLGTTSGGHYGVVPATIF